MALKDGASLEGLAAQIVAIGITHQMHNVLLNLLQYDVDNNRMAFEQLSLQVLAASLRLRELYNLALEVADL